MFLKIIAILLFITCCNLRPLAQCTTLGQTPASAFPVCGTDDFKQYHVPVCTNAQVPASQCGFYADVNPFWYKFTCYKLGTLDFVITPNDLKDDYDWELFDVTNATRPDDVYKNSSLFVAANWSGTYGKTGISFGTGETIVCGSDPGKSSPFSQPPVLQAGHNYLLLVSHYTPSQSGYTLSFNGGTAVISDTSRPLLKSAVSNCGGTQIGILLGKDVKCTSLATDGSDFIIFGVPAKIVSASSANCSGSFDMDSLVLTLDMPLPPGTYKVYAKVGTDGNTLLDNCNNALSAGDSTAVTVYSVLPTNMDSIIPVIPCGAPNIRLLFSKKIECNSIATDGSDFVVTGPQVVIVTKAIAYCEGVGLSNTIELAFSAALKLGGAYQVKLVKGSDGNTIIDECSQETPAGEMLGFTAGSSISASFDAQVKLGCRQDTVLLSHNGNSAANSWQWVFDDGTSLAGQNVKRIYNSYGTKSVKLLVSNGVCTDTSSQPLNFNNQLTAQFICPAFVCPGDDVVFKDSSIGKVMGWNWYFGNGNISNVQAPLYQIYPASTTEKNYTVRLIIQNDARCYDTAYHIIKALYSCYITVPTAFTPNGDGLNDYLYPLNGFKALNLEFMVYNRWGKQVFRTNNWASKWDGTVNGMAQPAGVYVWYLYYTSIDTGKKNFTKGTTVLIR